MGCCWRRLLVRLVVGVQRNHSDRGFWVTFGWWIKVCGLEPTPMCVRWYLLLCLHAVCMCNKWSAFFGVVLWGMGIGPGVYSLLVGYVYLLFFIGLDWILRCCCHANAEKLP